MSQNKVSLIGFTGTDPQVRTTKNNRTFAVLSVATKRSWRDKQTGERVSRTEWHRVIAWGKLGDLAKTLAKGSRVQIAGELRSRTYTGEDNIRRRVSEVHLGSIRNRRRQPRNAMTAYRVAEPGAAESLDRDKLPQETNWLRTSFRKPAPRRRYAQHVRDRRSMGSPTIVGIGITSGNCIPGYRVPREAKSKGCHRSHGRHSRDNLSRGATPPWERTP
jgi:single-strand DNA-binding protein